MQRLKQAYRLGRLVTRPGGARAALRWRPFSITAFDMMKALQQQSFSFGMILDGGANIGQFARAAVETFPEAKVIAIEPLPDIAQRLRENLKDRPQVQVKETALGSSDGILTFHRNAYSLASSALSLLPEAATTFPGLAEVETLEVPVTRIDSIFPGMELVSPFLIKLDLQGFELEALRGAQRTLRHTDFLLLEIAFQPLYDAEPRFEELLDYVRAAGFRFLRPLDVLRDARGVIVQMDALFEHVS